MKRATDGRIVLKIGGVLLLLLALSPFTAPFLTCDIADFVGGSPTRDRAILSSKAAPDDPTAALASPHYFEEPRNESPMAAPPAERSAFSVQPFRIPLRI